MSTTLVRQNFHADSETAINKAVHSLLAVSYKYLSMAYYFERDDVSLGNVSKLFHHLSNEQREHGMELMEYMNMRGGRCVLTDIPRPEKDVWGTAEEALKSALETEKALNQQFIDLHDVASKHGDPQMSDYIEEEYLAEEAQFIKKLGDFLAEVKRAGPNLGEYMFDKETLEGSNPLGDPDLGKA